MRKGKGKRRERKNKIRKKIISKKDYDAGGGEGGDSEQRHFPNNCKSAVKTTHKFAAAID
jgi:hypothetical protein